MTAIKPSASSPSLPGTFRTSDPAPLGKARTPGAEPSRPDTNTRGAPPPGGQYAVRDGWDDAPPAPNPNPGTADVHQVQQAVPTQEGTGTNIDWDFIAEQEGAGLQDGYVPAAENSQSGVTVGTGVDLGARNSADLEQLGLSESLQEKLEPYLGLRQQDAVDALAQNPLQLTADEVDELDQAVRSHEVDSLVEAYNGEVETRNAEDGGSRVPFEELPEQMQTVIASVHFQYGTLSTETPNFFSQVVDQRWDDALGNLRDFGDDYSSRRNREADLLESATGAHL